MLSFNLFPTICVLLFAFASLFATAFDLGHDSAWQQPHQVDTIEGRQFYARAPQHSFAHELYLRDPDTLNHLAGLFL